MNEPIPQRVHLVGIGGMHMSGIARVLKSLGHDVSGSDSRPSALTAELEVLGVRVFEGHDAGNIAGAQLVVTTSAAKPDNPELLEAQRLGIAVVKRHDFVAKLMEGKRSVCIAGTHGKTTTSGLVATMLVKDKRSPTYLVGGDIVDLGGNAAHGNGREIVVEADEYDRAFLAYQPDISIVLNVEADHPDIYGTSEDYVAAFAQFIAQTNEHGLIIACIDSPNVKTLIENLPPRRRIQTYSLTTTADVQVRDIRPTPSGGFTFDVIFDGREETFELRLPGRHNIANAVAAIMAGRELGISIPSLRDTVAEYAGARRRFELIGEAAGVTVIDDYAHHPTEIKANVSAAKERFPGRRLIACFQPHTFSRTEFLIEDFTACFEGLDELVLVATYAAREHESQGVDAKTLSERVSSPKARYASTFDEAVDASLNLLRAGDVFLTLGAGDVGTLAPLVLAGLEKRGERKSAHASTQRYSDALIADLEKITAVRRDEPLSRHTTFGVGGPADIYVVAQNSEELAAIILACREHGAPPFVLGSGSNILVRDGGIRGVVIENNAKALRGPDIADDGELRFTVDSGASFASVARSLARRGYAGLEWASGIPGTLGGAVVYNAGAYGGCLGDVLRSVSIINGTGRAKAVSAGELGLQYRGSAFTRGSYKDRIVLTAEFVAWPGDAQQLMERIQDLDTKRLSVQPRGRNAGSIFKNPPGAPAWKLIDSVGLRGHRIGDAMISDKHCNFFLNVGHASAADVEGLIELAQERVLEQSGISLEQEIGLVGEVTRGR